MAVTAANPAPYAPSSAVMDIVSRYRDKGLVTPFTAEVLGRAGVSDSLVPRVLNALITLDLITEDGTPTETLEGLRRAPESEFKSRLAAWVSSVYSDVLSFVNPTDDEQAIRDAFRAYSPIGQQGRMVSLFLGLCRAAGLREEEQARSAPRPAARKPATTSTARQTGGVTIKPPTARAAAAAAQAGLPPPIAGLLAKLPPDGGSWTQADRSKFEQAFKAMLDFCYTIREPQEEGGDDA